MICIKCGKKLTEEEKICPYCGKPHPDAKQSKSTGKKNILVAISTISLAISIAFLILILFYSIALLILGILVKSTLVKIIFLILKLILIFVIPPLLISIILKFIGEDHRKVK